MTDDQRVDLAGAFIGQYRFQIGSVPQDWVLSGNTAATKDCPALSGDVQIGRAHV